MKTLILLRHAKSSWDSPAANDFDRPLADRGLRDAPRMGKALKNSGLDVDRIVASTAVRATQTAELASSAAGLEKKLEFNDAIYGASADELFSVVNSLDQDHETVMLVGHNPGFEDLLGALCGPGRAAARVRVPTAALACVELASNDWSAVRPGDGTLAWMLVPKILG